MAQSAKTLVVAAPGDHVDPGCNAVMLLDGRPYPKSLFEAGYDDVTHSSSVECVDHEGGKAYQLSSAGSEQLAAIQATTPRVLFFASSDTHVNTFAPLARRCVNPKFVVLSGDDQLAIQSLDREGFEWVRHSGARSIWRDCDVVVTGNDWGPEDRLFIARTRRMGTPSVCLQESIIDFDSPMAMMQWADYAIIQGPLFLNFVRRDLSLIAGNPRYDSIEVLPLPAKPKAFINCNFTFGVFEEAGRGWVEDCVAAVKDEGIDHLVSVHPRCFINLEGIENAIPSNVYVVRDQLREASIIVTRFSSLAHEGLLMGRHVIYYNPHGETMRLLNEDPSGLVLQARTPADLRRCLRHALEASPPVSPGSTAQAKLQHLFCALDGQSHLRAVTALQVIAAQQKQYPVRDYLTVSEASLKRRMLIDRIRPYAKRVPFLRGAWRAIRGAGK